MKATSVRVQTEGDGVPAQFGLRIVLDIGPSRPINAASIVKPLFDGVIAAFHCHDGSSLDYIRRSVGATLHRPPGEVETQLMESSIAAWGRRRLLWPRAGGVQWNPADDGRVAGELLLTNSGAGRESSFSGELIEVRPTASR